MKARTMLVCSLIALLTAGSAFAADDPAGSKRLKCKTDSKLYAKGLKAAIIAKIKEIDEDSKPKVSVKVKAVESADRQLVDLTGGSTITLDPGAGPNTSTVTIGAPNLNTTIAACDIATKVIVKVKATYIENSIQKTIDSEQEFTVAYPGFFR